MSNSNKSNDLEFTNRINKLYQQKCSKYSNIHDINVLPAVDRIIVIGDLHGDFDKTIQCLKLAKVLQEDTRYDINSKKRYKWIGGETVIVQVGDQIDRCRNLPCNDPSSTKNDENSDIKILKFFTDLHLKAIKNGGAVYSLVGNHELMNVTGRMDYVSYQGSNQFEKEDSYGDKIYMDVLPSNITDMEARKWAFQPGNPIAEYIACTRKLILKIGDYLFVHAGILPIVAQQYPSDAGIKKMNEILSTYLFNKLDNKELSKHQLLLGPEIATNNVEAAFDNYHISPLWNRKFGKISRTSDEKYKSKTCSQIFNPIKKIYSVNKMFVGHTPQINNISSACNDGLWFTDVAMSKAFNDYNTKQKDSQVLLIENDKVQTLIG